MDLDAVADQLYGLTPADFAKARDAFVAQARKEGDRQTAEELKRMRRPSVGAWMANLLVRGHRDDIEHLVALGVSLRNAQDRLDGDAMRRLTGEGRAAVAALVEDATRLMREAGAKVSPAASEELEATLDAAFMDHDAAAPLRRGRLTNGLRYSGLGLLGLDGQGSSGAGQPKTFPGRSNRPTARKSELTAAERQLDVAKRDLARAKARRSKAEAAVTSARTRLKEFEERTAELRRAVREAEKAVRTAEHALGTLKARRT